MVLQLNDLAQVSHKHRYESVDRRDVTLTQDQRKWLDLQMRTDPELSCEVCIDCREVRVVASMTQAGWVEENSQNRMIRKDNLITK